MSNLKKALQLHGLQLTELQIDQIRNIAFAETRAKKIEEFKLTQSNKAQSILITMAITRSLEELLHMFYADSVSNNQKQRKDLKNLKNKCKMVVNQYINDIFGSEASKIAFEAISDEFNEAIYEYLHTAGEVKVKTK